MNFALSANAGCLRSHVPVVQGVEQVRRGQLGSVRDLAKTLKDEAVERQLRHVMIDALKPAKPLLVTLVFARHLRHAAMLPRLGSARAGRMRSTAALVSPIGPRPFLQAG